MRGNLAGALSLNPLMVIALPFIALLLLKPSLTHKRWLPWISFIILVVYGIVRNLPFWPFVLLAPH